MNVAAERIYSTWIEDRSRKQHGCAGRLWGWGGVGTRCGEVRNALVFWLVYWGKIQSVS